MRKHIKISVFFLLFFLGWSMISCSSQKRSKVEDFNYYNPDFRFDETFGLRTDGAYVNIMGPYTEIFSPNRFDQQFNRNAAQVDKLEVPSKDTTVTYYSYEIMIFCRQDGAYYYAHGYDFSPKKLNYFQKFSAAQICGKKYRNYYYRFQKDRIDLQHIEYWQNAKIKIKETARVSADALFLKKISSDWTKKRIETPFKFHPFNN
ncbi:hypothetical protein [Empedobacter brevis]|uniref:hypothetical protein n=1 Tax=Empedobacter brevis TaxID=247 RepID=UPI00289D710C|nr:hypothetical protein [Empedobacter brevis]